MTLAEAQELAALADARGLKIAAASDTFLGAALREARRLVDAGEIGELIGASALFTTPGSEACIRTRITCSPPGRSTTRASTS